jgi:hypothetical protein
MSAYTINNSQGAIVTTILDNTLDTTTSLTLIGQNKSNFGEKLNENLVFLLENFANSSQPTNPVSGQLWWDTSNKLLKVNTSATSTPTWKVVGSATSSASAPTSPSPITGDFWYDSTNKQLKVYNGTSWDLVGPDYTTTQGLSGQKVNTLTDTGAGSHTVVEFWVGGTLLAIFSKDSTSWSPLPSITGFSSIKAGLNFSTSISGISSGNAATLNGLTSSQFLRSDIATTNSNTTASSSTTTGALVVTGGVGIGGNLYVSTNIVVNGINVVQAINTVSAQLVSVDTKLSAQLVSVDTKLSNAVSAVSAQLTSVKNDLTSAINVVSAQVSALVAGNLSLGAVASDIIPTVNNTYTIGNTSKRWANVWATNIYGVASSAQYADLAEKFIPDQDYAEGTVVMVGGVNEITACQPNAKAIGAISLRPAYGMNTALENGVFVALKGRVPVRVVGAVTKGSELIPYDNGTAQVLGQNQGKPFAIALESNSDEAEKVIEALIL